MYVDGFTIRNLLSPSLSQVSHHPPMFAMHVEHKDWTLWEEYTVASKFRGKYVACYPIGITHLIFHRNGQSRLVNDAASIKHALHIRAVLTLVGLSLLPFLCLQNNR